MNNAKTPLPQSIFSAVKKIAALLTSPLFLPRGGKVKWSKGISMYIVQQLCLALKTHVRPTSPEYSGIWRERYSMFWYLLILFSSQFRTNFFSSISTLYFIFTCLNFPLLNNVPGTRKPRCSMNLKETLTNTGCKYHQRWQWPEASGSCGNINCLNWMQAFQYCQCIATDNVHLSSLHFYE